ncbi:hypothetical protein GCM10020254_06850 [Streptomyces goshikiensis]
MGAVEVREERGDVEGAARGTGDQPEGDPAAQQSGVLVHGLSHRVSGGQCGPRVGQHGPAHLGRGHRPVGPVEQGLPDLLLQLAYLGAEAGLGQMQSRGGTGETAFLDDGDEVAQLAELHNQRF